MNSLSRLRKIRAGYFTPAKTTGLWPNVVVVAQLQMRDTIGSRMTLLMMDRELYPNEESRRERPRTFKRRGMKRSHRRTRMVIGAKR